MIGGILVTHGSIGEALMESLAVILGSCCELLLSVSIKPEEDNEKILERITGSIAEVDSGDGVIVFTDMFGGTPSNLSLSLYEKGRVEVVTGVNLPMLVKYYNYRETLPLAELAEGVKTAGRGAIAVASEFLGHSTE